MEGEVAKLRQGLVADLETLIERNAALHKAMKMINRDFKNSVYQVDACLHVPLPQVLRVCCGYRL